MAVTAVRTPIEVGSGLSSRAAAEAYIGGVCFKQGPPALIGAELEWLTAHGESSAPGPRPELYELADALGSYAPRSISPESPALPLPGGSRVTIEPGGQIELSSAPFGTATELCERLRADTRLLEHLLESRSIRIISAAADGVRQPRRLLQLPRYRAMERAFAGIGPFGKLMMCNTAATQVSVDAGADRAEVSVRWGVLYAIGPALLAAFACSPDLHGVPAGAWASQRMRAWLRLDHARTRPPVRHWSDPVADYARWALDVPLLCVRGPDETTDWAAPPGATFADWLCGALDDEVGRRPDLADLDYHLTTMFPPVRASGHLEVRYVDAQPGDGWTVPIHAVEALMSTPAAVAEATRVAAPVADRWLEAARCGLADPEIRSAAVALLELAQAHAVTPVAARELGAAAHRCRSGRMPTGERARCADIDGPTGANAER
ncbi:ergothioneine biosynthesis glutamate--cysteine ligase EgtA [Nocardia terpenica]|uniref:Glutamate--cysteine ligase EgtA n=1 Tax=Nocardia terpenica TaxID=455432 RepID=A0A164L6J8_9NOCA|nr:ergothioneine biosynthesis glutamate--cysteine ligase EgtA [Nocardia terpenica]KZM72076.1 ergothioneine biosynthesis glutamate--cysteine ligase EgtA [Nocardia terpenica]MBF6060594.1 ergothioneine biosynthesis glutamate--cysteine ligase EgtA [Nocardia terpenica]MBF6103854.1 ergothioneine biosynthesis glutamate--cysteine ligase EgtA [Nocardia terpenica]MBF6111772.1 ergothioneine biosynthesis glutamate--cysteine ligase EgtA [Nocardia terpenica]MBF6118075.1 ergothioneine biosynthesis glutamate-